MLKEFVQEIARMAAPSTYQVNGETFSSEKLHHVEMPKDFPESIRLTGLDSVCRMVAHEANDLFPGDLILIQVEDYRNVRVFTTLDGEMDRCYLYRCCADTPNVDINCYMSHERAVIQLRSLYIPNADTEYLLRLLSSVSKESKVTSSDNGVTQTVEAKSGIALNQMVEVKPYVDLQPFRTFLEVPQPESRFIVRIDQNGNIGLFEADGGVWKLEAVRSIADYFESNLKELIDSGRVIVLR